MDKEELVEVSVSPSEEVVPASTTTTDTNNTAPVESTEQHADKQKQVEIVEEGKPETTEVKTEEIKVDDEDRIRKEREFNKMSKLERERNEYAKAAEELRKARYKENLEDLNDPATVNKVRNRLISNPQAYEEFRNTHKEMTGEDLGAYSQRFGQGGNQQTVENRTTDPTAIVKQVRAELQQEEEQKRQLEDAKAFWKIVPEMAPESAKTQEEYDQIITKAGAIERIASGFMQINPSLSRTEAYVKAWNNLDENRDKQVKFARESGELAGMAKAFNNASSTSSTVSGSGGAAIQSQSYKMTKAERDFYENLKADNPKLAEKYAKKAHQLHTES